MNTSNPVGAEYFWCNAFFRETDPCIPELAGQEIPEGWWSRRWEYAWAMTFAERGLTVADMGCGWHYRPFHDGLAQVCDFVYAVDANKGILELPAMQNGLFVVADFTQHIEAIPEASLDRVFCISVLEELFDYRPALEEFNRLLRPGGLVVLTCDAQHDFSKPQHEKYKGVELPRLETVMQESGFQFAGAVNRVRDSILLHNNDFNLCVWHCVMKKVRRAGRD